MKGCIIDASVLICLDKLNLLDKLILFFDEVRVPRKVEQEFLNLPDNIERNKKYNNLEIFYKNNNWFIRCQEYTDELITIYKNEKGMNDGEAEVFAQCQWLGNIHTLLIDEKIARNIADKFSYQKEGVLSIIAKMDIYFNLCNYKKSVEFLQIENKTFFSEKIINKVYNKILAEI